MPIVRVRQHVNPFHLKYQQAVSPPVWEQVYGNSELPLHLDIGCGRGRFLLEMAQLQPNWNFLGLEIREPLVIQANRWTAEQGLTNLYFLFGNANNSLQPVLQSLGTEALHRVTIQFPDPWFKKRHQKRRLVQPDIVNCLATYLVDDGIVFLQSDVETVAQEMCDRFQSHPNFFRTHAEWLKENPLPVPTERELSTLERGGEVYRAVFVKRERDGEIGRRGD